MLIAFSSYSCITYKLRGTTRLGFGVLTGVDGDGDELELGVSDWAIAFLLNEKNPLRKIFPCFL